MLEMIQVAYTAACLYPLYILSHVFEGDDHISIICLVKFFLLDNCEEHHRLII